MTDFFTADLHLGHANILKYTDRGEWFPSIGVHDEGVVEDWNKTVSQGDLVYLIGDVGWRRSSRQQVRLVELVSRLNGRKVLLHGNHDRIRDGSDLAGCFVERYDYKELDIRDEDAPGGKQHVSLFHYPISSWNRKHHGAWMFHGHSHSNDPGLYSPRMARVDVGVDAWSWRNRLEKGAEKVDGGDDFYPLYAPVSYDEIKTYLTKQLLTMGERGE